jgi:hypothetical protein
MLLFTGFLWVALFFFLYPMYQGRATFGALKEKKRRKAV